MTEEHETPRRFVRPGWRAIGAAATAAVVGVAALVAFQDPAPPPSRFTVAAGEEVSRPIQTDPLMAELLRCRSLPAGSDDAACQAAWEVNRRRFTGESRSYVAPPNSASTPASRVGER